MLHMSELPWFKFNSDKWLAGNIQGYDMQTQGIFVNLCARIWQDGGEMQESDRLAFIMHLDKQTLANAIHLLLDGDMLVRTDSGCLSSKFILLQLADMRDISSKRAVAGRKGGKAKQLSRRSKCQANAKQKGSNIDIDTERDKEQEVDTNPFPFVSDEFKTAWENWTTHRREIKKRLTPTQTTAQLKSMAKMGEARAIAAIYHTIEKGWQGLREPEERTIGAKVGNRGDTGRRVTGFEDMEGDQ